MTPDGRFIGVITAGQDELAAREMNSQIQVVVNWFEELKRMPPPR